MQEQRQKKQCPDLNCGRVDNRMKINADVRANGNTNKKKDNEYLLQMYDMYQQYASRRNKYNAQLSQLPRINKHNSSQILCSIQISQSKPINLLNDAKSKDNPSIMALNISNNPNCPNIMPPSSIPSIPYTPQSASSAPQAQLSQKCRRNLRTKLHRTCARILFNNLNIDTKIKGAYHKSHSKNKLYENIIKLANYDQGQAYTRICTMRDHDNFMQLMERIGKWFYGKQVNIINRKHPNMHPSQLQSIYNANLSYIFYNFDLLFQPRNMEQRGCKKDQASQKGQESQCQCQKQNWNQNYDQNQHQHQYQQQYEELGSLHSLDFGQYVGNRGENMRSSISDSWVIADNANQTHQEGRNQGGRQLQQQQGQVFGSHLSSQSNVNSLNYSKITNLQNMPIFKQQQQCFFYPQAQQQFPSQSAMISLLIQSKLNTKQQVVHTTKPFNSNSNSNSNSNCNYNNKSNLSMLSSLKQYCIRLVTAPFRTLRALSIYPQI